MNKPLFRQTFRLGAAACWCVATVLAADPLDRWHWRNPPPQGNDLLALAHGNGTFVAVGGYGTILTSIDATTWTVRSRETNYSLNGVAYGNGMFVAVGSRYREPSDYDVRADVILTSPDGINWTDGTTGLTNWLWSVAFGNGRFVAVGSDPRVQEGRFFNSTDGVTWVLRSTETNVPRHVVIFGNGMFVALQGYESPAAAMNLLSISNDGITWASVGLPLNPLGTVELNHAAFGNGRFVVVGSVFANGQGRSLIASSSDARDWSVRHIGPSDFGPNQQLTAVGYGLLPGSGSRFVAMGRKRDIRDGRANPKGSNILMTSPDGETWSEQPGLPLLEQPEDILFHNGTFVAVGDFGNIAASTNGSNWTTISDATSRNLRDIGQGNGLLVAVGNDGATLTSPDGIVWTEHPPTTGRNLHAVAHGTGLFVTVGNRGTILTSTNGSNWTERASGTSENLDGVVWDNGMFVAVGGHCFNDCEQFSFAITTSRDGVNWTAASGGGRQLHGVTCGNGLFVAVGRPGAVMTSSNGIQWTTNFVGFSYLKGVAFGNGRFVAVGEYGCRILTSTNGQNWTANRSGLGYTNSAGGEECSIELDEVAFANGVFVVVGDNGTILTSSDGEHWTRRHSPTDTNLRGLTFAHDSFVVVGNNGIILQSDVFARLRSPRLTNGVFGFELLGQVGRLYRIESSSNLADWTIVTNLTASGPVSAAADSADSSRQRFYRAVEL